jgi:hypothetical protein
MRRCDVSLGPQSFDGLNNLRLVLGTGTRAMFRFEQTSGESGQDGESKSTEEIV